MKYKVGDKVSLKLATGLLLDVEFSARPVTVVGVLPNNEYKVRMDSGVTGYCHEDEMSLAEES